MKLKILGVIFLAAVLLSACSGKSTNEGSPLKANETSDIKGLVHDYSARKIKAQNVSITSGQLIVTDRDGKESAYDLPKKEFFVSIAPYITQTHP